MAWAAGATAANGQALAGEWVQRSEERIGEIRKTPVEVLVLNGEGKPQGGAAVRMRMVRHAFAFGLEVNPAGFDPEAHRGEMAEQPVWRCLSAVSLERGGDWKTIEPRPTQWHLGWPQKVCDWARSEGMGVRWGRLFSADAGELPAWTRGLSREALYEAMRRQAGMVLTRFGRAAEDCDVFSDAVDNDPAEVLGVAGLRRLYQEAGAAEPGARLSIRFENALEPERFQRVIQRYAGVGQAFVPIKAVTLEGRLSAPVVQGQLAAALETVRQLGKPVILAGLEAGGATPGAAAVNLEVVLRTAFANLGVVGIYLHGLKAQELRDPNAALLDEAGELTECGRVFEGLVRGQWWTDAYVRTNEIGSARLTVFAGWYEVWATSDGQEKVLAKVYVPAQAENFLFAVQPLAPAPAPGSPPEGAPGRAPGNAPDEAASATEAGRGERPPSGGVIWSTDDPAAPEGP